MRPTRGQFPQMQKPVYFEYSLTIVLHTNKNNLDDYAGLFWKYL